MSKLMLYQIIPIPKNLVQQCLRHYPETMRSHFFLRKSH